MFDGLALPPGAGSPLELDTLDGINRRLRCFFPLSEPGGALGRDISPYRRLATQTGGRSVVGRNGRAINLGFGEHLTVRQQTVGGALSGAFWLRAPTASGGGYEQVTADLNDEWGFSWRHDGAGYAGAIYLKSGGSYPAAQIPTALLTANTWHLIGFSWDGATLRAYHNGLHKASASATSMGGVNANFYIGRGGADWSGDLALYRLWDRAVTPSEFQRLYSEPKAGAFDPAARLFFAVRSGALQPIAGSAPITLADATAAATGALAIAGTASVTLADATIVATGELSAADGPSGSYRRRGRYKVWQDVPAELHPVVSLAENYADADAVERAVDAALAKYARQMARASIARRNTLLEELKQSIVNAVERAAEADDEEALLALM